MVILTLDGGVVGVVFEFFLCDIVGQTKLKKKQYKKGFRVLMNFDRFLIMCANFNSEQAIVVTIVW
jgi:hypothetical protein